MTFDLRWALVILWAWTSAVLWQLGMQSKIKKVTSTVVLLKMYELITSTKLGFFLHIGNCPKKLPNFLFWKITLFWTSILFSIMVWQGSQANSLETVCACQCIFIYSSISITGPIICLQSGSLQTNYPCENTRLHFFEIESFGLNHLLGRHSFAFINSVLHGYMYWKRIILISNSKAHLC